MNESEGHTRESIADKDELVEKHNTNGRGKVEYYAHSNMLG